MRKRKDRHERTITYDDLNLHVSRTVVSAEGFYNQAAKSIGRKNLKILVPMTHCYAEDNPKVQDIYP